MIDTKDEIAQRDLQAGGGFIKNGQDGGKCPPSDQLGLIFPAHQAE